MASKNCSADSRNLNNKKCFSAPKSTVIHVATFLYDT